MKKGKKNNLWLIRKHFLFLLLLLLSFFAAGLRVVYKNGARPSLKFKNRDDDATEEVARLETWRAEHIADYLREKLRDNPETSSPEEQEPPSEHKTVLKKKTVKEKEGKASNTEAGPSSSAASESSEKTTTTTTKKKAKKKNAKTSKK